MVEPGRTVRVGVAVVMRSYTDCVLMCLRKGSHGEGTWGLPGGKIELGEDPIETAKRELFEETGITLPQGAILAIHREYPWLSTPHIPNTDHWITLFFEVFLPEEAGELTVQHMEPDKHSCWCWFPTDKLPTNLFGALTEEVLQL